MSTLLPNNPAVVLQPAGSLAALSLDKTFTAADTSAGNSFLSSGRDLLIIYNSDGSAHDVTLHSAPDDEGRSVDVVYNVGIGVYSFIEINSASIFVQPNTNLVSFSCASSAVRFLVVMNG